MEAAAPTHKERPEVGEHESDVRQPSGFWSGKQVVYSHKLLVTAGVTTKIQKLPSPQPHEKTRITLSPDFSQRHRPGTDLGPGDRHEYFSYEVGRG